VSDREAAIRADWKDAPTDPDARIEQVAQADIAFLLAELDAARTEGIDHALYEMVCEERDRLEAELAAAREALDHLLDALDSERPRYASEAVRQAVALARTALAARELPEPLAAERRAAGLDPA
jgi:hypothetical protein